MKWMTALGTTILFTSSVSLGRIDIPWDHNSDPDIMSPYFSRKFQELPLSGRVKDRKKYWSGDYWALKRGNINYRWYAKNKIGHNLSSPDKVRASSMSIPELAELSPSEKYDLFIGRYDYPLRNEVAKVADLNAMNWEGICHGWSPATMNHNEPTPKLLMNPDGIEIPFGSSDIKALLSYYYAYSHKAPDTHQMGRRCFKGRLATNENDCNEDMNAGAFHIVLANRLGKDGRGFIADLERFEQVWNHPITSYKTDIIREHAPDRSSAPGTKRKVEVRTVISYLDENGNDWHPVIGTSKQAYETITYQYKLDVDADGLIIGGDWISRKRPDFLWIMSRPRDFQGILSRLGELLNDD